MKLIFNYGNAVAVLPQSVFDKIDKATKKDMKLIFVLASDMTLLRDTEKAMDELTLRTGMKSEDINNSLSFWRGAGVLDEFEGMAAEVKKSSEKQRENFPENPQKASKKFRSADELPRYTTEELTALLEKRDECRFLIDECQRLFGKVFNTSEINILVALTDYLALDSEYILLLFAHCGKLEHKSVRMVEKLAHRFLDEEITDAETLSGRLRFLERAEQTERKVRSVFGITARALTKKEKALIEKWLSEYNYDFDIIEKAYELTIDSTQNPSLPYAGAIMDRWYSEGIKTLDDVERDIEEHKKNKAAESGSFDTDEFLEAALKRSFEGK